MASQKIENIFFEHLYFCINSIGLTNLFYWLNPWKHYINIRQMFRLITSV